MLGQREGEKIEDKKERECEDMWMGELLREKKKVLPTWTNSNRCDTQI